MSGVYVTYDTSPNDAASLNEKSSKNSQNKHNMSVVMSNECFKQ